MEITAEGKKRLQETHNSAAAGWQFKAGVMSQICLFTLTEAVKPECRHTQLQTAPGPRWQNVLDFTSWQRTAPRSWKVQRKKETGDADEKFDSE